MNDLDQIVLVINRYLDKDLPEHLDIAPKLVEAMRYVTLNGGKRLRPALLCATATAFDASLNTALAPAAAIEYVHTYSLVPDHLPDMDDDTQPRGDPTCHIAFDEATAILVGDALQALAFETLSTAKDIDADRRIVLVELLARAAGWKNMIAGQTLDINSTGVDVSLSLSKLKDLHSAKTGAMFRSAIQMGCVIAGEYNSSIYKTMTNVGDKLGLAFQVVDDILDVTRTTKELGKPSGSDIKLNKTTFPSLLGVEHSRTLSIELFDEAVELLHQTGAANSTLVTLAKKIVERLY